MTIKTRTAESKQDRRLKKRFDYIMRLLESLADSEYVDFGDSGKLRLINLQLNTMRQKYDHGRY